MDCRVVKIREAVRILVVVVATGVRNQVVVVPVASLVGAMEVQVIVSSINNGILGGLNTRNEVGHNGLLLPAHFPRKVGPVHQQTVVLVYWVRDLSKLIRLFHQLVSPLMHQRTLLHLFTP